MDGSLKRNFLVLSELTPKEMLQLDTQKGLHFPLRKKLVLEEQVTRITTLCVSVAVKIRIQ